MFPRCLETVTTQTRAVTLVVTILHESVHLGQLSEGGGAERGISGDQQNTQHSLLQSNFFANGCQLCSSDFEPTVDDFASEKDSGPTFDNLDESLCIFYEIRD